jgi:hypothetical protein
MSVTQEVVGSSPISVATQEARKVFCGLCQFWPPSRAFQGNASPQTRSCASLYTGDASTCRHLGDVDGHDAGSAEMSIFMLTDHPEAAFNRIQQ